MFITTLILDLVVCIIAFFSLSKARLRRVRGTNALTDVVRDSSAYSSYKRTIALCLCSSIGVIVIGCAEDLLCLISGVPTLLVALYALKLMQESTEDENRVKQVRVITENTGSAIGNSVVVASQIVAKLTPIDEVVGEENFQQVAAGVGNAVKKSTDFDDVEGLNLMDKSDFNTDDFYQLDSSQLRLNASNFGILTDGLTDEQIASRFLEVAPPSAIQALPDNMSDVERADRIMRGLY